jgi:hypothetical protein
MPDYQAIAALDANTVLSAGNINKHNLAATVSRLICQTGIYHGDGQQRLFAPRKTSFPWPTRIDWDLLFRPDRIQGIAAVSEECKKMLAACVVRHLRQHNIAGYSLTPASSSAEALMPWLQRREDSRGRVKNVLFDTTLRTGRTAFKQLENHGLAAELSRGFDHYCSIVDLDHGGRQCLRARNIDVSSIMTRRDLYIINPENSHAPFVSNEHLLMLQRYRGLGARAAIEDVYRHKDNLEALFVPYRDVPVQETVACVLMRLALENAVLPHLLHETDAELETAKRQNYRFIDEAGIRYCNAWWAPFIAAVFENDGLCSKDASEKCAVPSCLAPSAACIKTREQQIIRYWQIVKDAVQRIPSFSFEYELF